MKAWLVKNKYLVSENFTKLEEIILKSAKEHKVDITVYNNIEIINVLSEKNYEKPDFVLFWDKDVKLASFIESQDIKIFNSSTAIKTCDDKSLTYLALINADIMMPKTIFSPLIYYHSLSDESDFIDFVEKHLNYPFVYKECVGSFGMQVYLVNDRDEFIKRIINSGINPFICQEYIMTSKGRDLRLYVVGDEVVGTMKRENKNGDFRANIELGGIGTKYEANDRQKALAIKAVKTLDLDFAGVDILFGKDDEPLLCEVNSNAYFVGFNETTGLNVADKIFEYILKKV